MAVKILEEEENAQMTLDSIAMFQPLTGIHEPSGIQQLADGRFLVVEDEEQHPFSVVTIDRDGAVITTALKPGFFHAYPVDTGCH